MLTARVRHACCIEGRNSLLVPGLSMHTLTAMARMRPMHTLKVSENAKLARGWGFSDEVAPACLLPAC